MDKYEDDVMVALLPIHAPWAKVDLPHLTLVYAGKIAELKKTDFTKLAKEAASLAMLSKTVHTRVIEKAQFGGGTEELVDVLRVQLTPELAAMRHFLADWNVSEYEFNPHVTVGPVNPGDRLFEIPPMIAFDTMLVAWGNEHINFRLGR